MFYTKHQTLSNEREDNIRIFRSNRAFWIFFIILLFLTTIFLVLLGLGTYSENNSFGAAAPFLFWAFIFFFINILCVCALLFFKITVSNKGISGPKLLQGSFSIRLHPEMIFIPWEDVSSIKTIKSGAMQGYCIYSKNGEKIQIGLTEKQQELLSIIKTRTGKNIIE